tara:strand:+ start:3237 stop:3788 length:552 start_codon:yes stop_codon:yes gene_type:complete
MNVSEFSLDGWILFLFGALIGLLGFGLGKIRRRTKIDKPASIEIEKEEESDDPTAPIKPMVEIAKSPHDRHRDMEVGNAVVKNLDLLEILIKSAGRQSKEDLVSQLNILHGDMNGLLEGCSYNTYEYEPGTPVDSTIRSRILVVEGKAEGDRTRIDKTLQRGVLYCPEDEEEIVIRKAEVKIC